ncbi:CENP-X/MHF2 family protein [Aspergillus glaucus CBS 516.65]|uniref:Centromere protein X n=1 Tax=Aspergillus glaucus CBS 516.65 TaxID=1160497 RepID=A0A1L9VV92_ASPGL|nr:hypothetical protein ASPGLDRAFT_63933 [Aspergillus glaucus CBS 516.65]OJJ87833.1 hypothetical protein ASPGLDRAFT_63933 [Aspergillus glaucus CBS 516.65]
MPVERQPAQKRRRLPFNPPRRASPGEGPSNPAPATKSNTKNTTTTSSSTSNPKLKRKSTTTASSSRKKAPSPTPSASPSDSAPEDNNNRDPSEDEEPNYMLAEIIYGKESKDVTTSDPAIPGKLLTRLLHHNFQSEKTKIAKDANEVVAKYIDVFVREALARAAYERAEGGGGGGSVGDGFLEVEDLEKMAPQLVLDF